VLRFEEKPQDKAFVPKPVGIDHEAPTLIEIQVLKFEPPDHVVMIPETLLKMS
jgi:hypothetical protein